MKLAPESVIVCEGYHDRAFLNGLLLWRGCEALKDKPYRDGKKVKGKGQYAFRTPRGGWLRLVPSHGDSRLLESSETFIREGKTHPLARLLIVRDDDNLAVARDGGEATHDAQRAALESWARSLGARRLDGTEDFELGGGVCPTRISFMIWRSPDPDALHLPAKQTLERLVCAAIAEAHGPRCKAVEAWLASRPDPPPDELLHKSHAASHMAGWFSDRGYEGLFGAVWDDDGIRDALLKRLRETGADGVIDALLDE